MTLGEKIRYLREVSNISQAVLGEKTNMTQRKISYIENDRYEPCIADIKELCLFFGVSADYLLDLSDDLEYPKR